MEKLAAKKITTWKKKPPKNWVLKLVSLFFALFLWYFVVGEDKVDKTLMIPVEILNLPADITISNQFKRELEITVNGPRGLVRNLSQQHLSRPIDLSKAAPGTRVVKNTPDSFSLPRGVRMLRVKPTDIILQLDKQIKKNIPIQAITKGMPPSGFELVAITPEPASITTTGPQALIDDMHSISTEPIDLTQLTKPTKKAVPLQLTAEISDLVGEPVITVSINIREIKEEKTIENIPVQLILADHKSYTIKPESVTVKANIPFSKLKETKDLKSLFTARIIGGELSEGKHKLTVEIIPQNGVDLLEVIPEMAIVDIAPTKGKTKPSITNSP